MTQNQKKTKKQFSPHIYAEWGELFEFLTIEQRADILMAITKFPTYEPKENPIWAFIKSQLQKDYELFIDRCEKNAEISREYWSRKKSTDTERIPNDTERHPKHITTNELPITDYDITTNELPKQKKPKSKKSDPYFNPIKDIFLKEYQNIFNKQGFLSNAHILKLSELDNTIECLKDKIPEVLHKLKDINWDIDYKPDINWLLKDDNFISILNGEHDKKMPTEKQVDKNKLLEMANYVLERKANE